MKTLTERRKELKETKNKLKIGDGVWVKVPINATIKKVSSNGYTLVDDSGTEYEYFGRNELRLIKQK